MTDDRLAPLLRDAVQEYHRPPETPRDELWRRIVAARAARRRAGRRRPWLPWSLGIAAVLAVGIGIGRWTARRPDFTTSARGPVEAAPASGTLAYRVAATQYLTRTEALLTDVRSRGGAGRPDAQWVRQAHDLLTTTRLMLDSPAAQDPRLRSLLEDLELVLAQIAQLPATGAWVDVQLLNETLEQRSVLLRLETANPAGSGPGRTPGAS